MGLQTNELVSATSFVVWLVLRWSPVVRSVRGSVYSAFVFVMHRSPVVQVSDSQCVLRQLNDAVKSRETCAVN